MSTHVEGGAGVGSEHARELLAVHGPNVPPSAPRRRLAARILAQLRDPMILVLLAAGTITALLRDRSDAAIIAFVVVFNTTVGVVQQVRADRAVAAVAALCSPQASVLRDGRPVTIPAEQVVPGDLLVLGPGALVAADARIVAGDGVEVDESALSGESAPVTRGVGEEVLAGTIVTRGRCRAEVSRTGAGSALGQIAAAMSDTISRPTPLQRRLTRLSRQLVVVVLAATALVVAIGLVQRRSVLEMAVIGVSLAVAAVPESLPAVVTVALALGAHRMARRNAVARNLPAVETLGSVTVIATDKTGTLTEGRLAPSVVWTPDDGWRAATTQLPSGSARLLRDVALCGDVQLADLEGGTGGPGDPVDRALLQLAADQGGLPEPGWIRVAERSFDATARRMTTVHQAPGGALLTITKGAPETVLERVRGDTGAARATADELAARGMRVLAVAERTDREPPGVRTQDLEARGLELVGLVGLADPPREAASAVVAACHAAGIRLLLVTGDHPATAEAIAARVGISAAQDVRMDGRGPVFARVLPQDKLSIVDALQRDGEVVAMLGDGVNDGPALRRADIGVAAGRGGTEVARQAADLVLMDDDLGTVVAAIEEGRRVLASVRAFLVFAVSGGLAELCVMLAGPLVGISLPMTAAQILWINLVTHGLTGVAFGAQPLDPGEMRAPPTPVGAGLVGRLAAVRVGVIAVVLAAAALAAGRAAPGDRRTTAIFLVLGLGQLGVGWVVGSHGTAARAVRLLGSMIVLSAALMAAATVVPGLEELLGTTRPQVRDLALLALALVPAAAAGVLLRRDHGTLVLRSGA